MSAIDDLKEQAQTLAIKLGDRIQDLPAYQKAKDRFDALSYQAQKGVVVGGAVLLWLAVLAVPFSWYSQSQEGVTAFEERRSVIRELLKVSREAAEVPAIPPAPPVETMKSDLEMRLKSANLLPDQIKAIDAGPGSSSLIPSDRSSGGLTVNLWKLNVRQIVDVGTQLSRLSPSVKLTGVDMVTNKDDKAYFDVTYRLVALAVPDLSAPPPDEPAPKAAKGSKKKAPKGDDE